VGLQLADLKGGALVDIFPEIKEILFFRKN
jgi:hypothetical protein